MEFQDVVAVPGDVQEDLQCGFVKVDHLVAELAEGFLTCPLAANAGVVDRGALAAVLVRLEGLRAYADPVPGAVVAFLSPDVGLGALDHPGQASERHCSHRQDVLDDAALARAVVHVDGLAYAADEGPAALPPLHEVEMVVEAGAAAVIVAAGDQLDGRA